jgi:CAAX prenyl protease-like protein
MAVSRGIGLTPEIDFPLRFTVAALLLLLFSRRHLDLRPSRPLASIGMGIVVFLVWIGPDLLFGPGYRHFWIFENGILGKAEAAISPGLRRNIPFLILRAASAVVVVPILEELFWRGWLMRWLVKPAFQDVPFGTYVRSAFWIVAVLFASEHGPYWEVGLAAGILYNWWAVRTRCLADCILAHAVTNAILSAYVLLNDQWQYWL